MTLINLLVIISLLLFAGFLAGSESALTSLSRVLVEEIVEAKPKYAKKFAKLLDNPARYLNVLLLVRKGCELTATVFVADYAILRDDNNGFVLATNVNSKLGQVLNKLQGSKFAPDGVEIFNAKSGGYRDIDIDFPRFVNSGSTSAADLDDSNVFSLLPRKKAQEMGLIQGDQGVDYIPKYLKPNTGVV
jgi:hypothetical protein